MLATEFRVVRMPILNMQFYTNRRSGVTCRGRKMRDHTSEATNPLRDALNRVDDHSRSHTERGLYFERLVMIYLQHDNVQKQHYDQVWRYSDWAAENNVKRTDTGIDLIARLRGRNEFAAIQCKYRSDTGKISKSEIDSFVATSYNLGIRNLVLADTLSCDLSGNAYYTLSGEGNNFHRITLSSMEDSNIDWSEYYTTEEIISRPKKQTRGYQDRAIDSVCEGLKTANRGSLVMACGTGKTFTSLRIAERMAGEGGAVLFMVPSLALMSQTLKEWKADAAVDFNAHAICSDVSVGNVKSDNNDIVEIGVHDLPFPATTNAENIANQVRDLRTAKKMTVIFSTYHSIETVSIAQRDYGLPKFDLIICDEAHRTVGADLAERAKRDEESKWLRIHSDSHVAGSKRLYMTATPKVYRDSAKETAKEKDYILASMDDESTFGKCLYEYGFSEAVEDDVLSDYKVIVFIADESVVSEGLINTLAESGEMKLDDAAKLVGCYRALTKQNLEREDVSAPMARSLAFCANIKKSKIVAKEFNRVVQEFKKCEKSEHNLLLETEHVDGKDSAARREECLDWLKDHTDKDVCKVLSNARCLSEGVDVPALDAIIFMHPRNSQVDVIQAVGRVMRKSPGKKMGYVILPIAMKADDDSSKFLGTNQQYKVIWQVLNALRAHDNRFQYKINQISEGEDVSDKIEIIGVKNMSDIGSKVVVENFSIPPKAASDGLGIGSGSDRDDNDDRSNDTIDHPGYQSDLFVDELSGALLPMIVSRCGDKAYWDVLSKNLKEITDAYRARIGAIVSDRGSSAGIAFNEFVKEIRDGFNPSMTSKDAIDMLSQHLAIKPVFDAIFDDHEFTKYNPVSISMNRVLDKLEWKNLDNEASDMKEFYSSVRKQIIGIKTPKGRQTLLKKIYEKLFRDAFPEMASLLGIVYTPVEIVDFIINSVNEALVDDFGLELGSEGVRILDPFTGTGTFVTRLLQSGLIKSGDLERKYKSEILANEIVPLAYYAAAINIEQVYHELVGEKASYAPFEGITMTDTFQLFERKSDLLSSYFAENSNRRNIQRKSAIHVIVGNPPYSTGRSSQIGSANVKYEALDARIKEMYSKGSARTLVKELSNSYVKALRWATERIMEDGDGKGIVAFVTGGGWTEKAFGDQMRRRMQDEYSKIYIFHLRGDVRAQIKSKENKWQGENVFGNNSSIGISINILVRNPEISGKGKIFFYDISSNNKNSNGLSREEKLKVISQLGSIKGISKINGWQKIEPDAYGDWLRKRDPSYQKFPLLGSKKGDSVFRNYTHGVKSNRDLWVYNFDKDYLATKMNSCIDFYNSELERVDSASKTNIDTRSIKWTRGLKQQFERRKVASSSNGSILQVMRRPFVKTNLYFDPMFIEVPGDSCDYFPKSSENLAILVSGESSISGFSALMVNGVPDYGLIEIGRCFPLHTFTSNAEVGGGAIYSRGVRL